MFEFVTQHQFIRHAPGGLPPDRPVGSCLRPGDSRIRPWCHVGFAEDGRERRNELLTIHSTAIGYELGLGYSTFPGPFLRQD